MSKDNKIETKPSTYRKNDKFEDGSIIKKKYFYDDVKKYVIYLDSNNEIKYKMDGVHKLDKVNKLPIISGELFLIPNFMREDLNLELAYAIKLAICSEELAANKVSENLQNQIYSRKKLIKKFIYLGTPILLSLLVYIVGVLLIKFFLNQNNSLKLSEYSVLILFSGMGSFLSISKNINKIEFDTSEVVGTYFIFATFKYLHSAFSSILLLILYESRLINAEFSNVSENLFLGILATLGSFSESLIPNIFDKFSSKIG